MLNIEDKCKMKLIVYEKKTLQSQVIIKYFDARKNLRIKNTNTRFNGGGVAKLGK